MKNYSQIAMRMATDVKEAAQRKAADERRSFAAQVEQIVADDLKRSGYLPASRDAASEGA
jgi:hypothetical protein